MSGTVPKDKAYVEMLIQSDFVEDFSVVVRHIFKSESTAQFEFLARVKN